MPRTFEKRSLELAIHLEREEPAFTLPDIIVGHVFRQAPIVTPEATLTITLVGRSKSRMVVRHGSWGNIYRSRCPLVDETQTLLSAPLHLAADEGQKTWPFTITLPTQYDARRAPTADTERDDSFLALSPNETASCSLPSTFLDEKWGYGEGMGCFVEYFLRAELTTTSRGSTKVVEAIQPLIITTLHRAVRSRHTPLREARQVHTLEREGIVHQARTASDASQRARERALVALQPALTFAIVVRTPAALHLDQSGHVRLSILAEPSPTTPNGTESITPDITVSNITMHLVASTSIKCQSRKGPREHGNATRTRLQTKRANLDQAALSVPWVRDSGMVTVEQGQMIDHGRQLGLQMPSHGISESFTTHNIQHCHRLEWKIIFRVAEQSFTSSGYNIVEILAPSRDDAPTDYRHSEAEIMVRRDSARDEGMPPEYTEVNAEQCAQVPQQRERQQSRVGMADGLSRLWGGY